MTNTSFTTRIYIAGYPSSINIEPLLPIERFEYITSASNEKVKIQRYAVWKLLEHAVYDTLGIKIENLHLKRSERGKWECPFVRLSLSHTDSAVAVALSQAPVGVDIEPINLHEPSRCDKLAKKILTPQELCEYQRLSESERNLFFIEKWTSKEAVFKSLDEPVFSPSSLDTSGYSVITSKVLIEGSDFIFSLAHGGGKVITLVKSKADYL